MSKELFLEDIKKLLPLLDWLIQEYGVQVLEESGNPLDKEEITSIRRLLNATALSNKEKSP